MIYFSRKNDEISEVTIMPKFDKVLLASDFDNTLVYTEGALARGEDDLGLRRELLVDEPRIDRDAVTADADTGRVDVYSGVAVCKLDELLGFAGAFFAD